MTDFLHSREVCRAYMLECRSVCNVHACERAVRSDLLVGTCVTRGAKSSRGEGVWFVGDRLHHEEVMRVWGTGWSFCLPAS